jgi:Asp-tRNA(Asn)/Glu-tRNA(Gln) amidotransferase A subunit family amidase
MTALESLPHRQIALEELTIADIRAAFDRGDYGAEDLARAYLARIDSYEPFYNAFTFMNPSAIQDARAADQRRQSGRKLSPLDGIPVVVKETMDVAGLPSTAGWGELASAAGGLHLVATVDATVVRRLKTAGAVILGKTNVPRFSDDGARANTSWKGPTYNAVDRRIVPGASSSGTATAVSANFAVAGLAEETGGSIQNPAAAQSLVSVKPTFALVPTSGVVPLAASTRDVVGPHARTVRDAAMLLDAIAGFSHEDPKTVAAVGRIPRSGYGRALNKRSLRGARAGLYGPGWRGDTLSPETGQLYSVAVKEIQGRGCTVVDDPFARSDFSALADRSVRFDARGMESMIYDLNQYLARLGPGSHVNSVNTLLRSVPTNPFAQDELLGAYVKRMPILEGSLADPRVEPDLAPFAALRDEYLRVFDGVMVDHGLDLLVFPQMSAELPGIFGKERYPSTTVSEINIAGLPAVTVPAGRYSNGSPFSLLLVGRLWDDAKLLSYAYDYEQATRHRIKPVLDEVPFDRD